MKKYRLKAQYQIAIYLLILFILLYLMTIYEKITLLIVIYYIIAYKLISRINNTLRSTKKEDHRTTSKSLGSSNK